MLCNMLLPHTVSTTVPQHSQTNLQATVSVIHPLQVLLDCTRQEHVWPGRLCLLPYCVNIKCKQHVDASCMSSFVMLIRYNYYTCMKDFYYQKLREILKNN